MKILTNFNGLKSTRKQEQKIDEIEFGVAEVKPPIDINVTKTSGTFNEVLEFGKQNAKCNIDYSNLKIEGNPITEYTKFKFDNNAEDEIIKLSKEFSDKIDKFNIIIGIKKEDDDDDSDSEKIKCEIANIKDEMNMLSRKMRAIVYMTLCGMYEGVLIDGKLSVRKGEAYEYKHHRPIYMNTFFKLLIENKIELYKRLGFEKSILVEELLNRLIDAEILIQRIDDNSDSADYYLERVDDHYYNDNEKSWMHKNAIKNEIENINDFKIHFNKPYLLLNKKNNSTFERVQVSGISIQSKRQENEIINFLGNELDETKYRSRRVGGDIFLDLHFGVYNYLYKLNEKVINDALCKTVFEMKKPLMQRQTHFNIMQEKCNKFLLVAGLTGVKMDDIIMRY